MENRKQVKSKTPLEMEMENFHEDIERRKLMEPAKPFSPSEMTPDAKQKRLQAGKKDFWAFDGFYFTPDMYSDGYSKPAPYHKELVKYMLAPGVDVELGPRKHAKTATAKKAFVWLMLTRVKFGGASSSTLPVSRNILADITELLHSERIIYDYGIEFIEDNADQVTFRIAGQKGNKRIKAFSEGVSVRGSTKLFDRPQLILIDDLETLNSPLGDEQTAKRIKIISESFQSLSSSGSILVLGNNFSEKCALNRLLQEQNDGILNENYRVHVHPAWDGKSPLWPQRFPATTEDELKSLVQCKDESEWQAEFQQNPVPPDGFIFRRLSPLPSFQALPDDARGVIYCDPNLSKKGKGDSTAIISLLYSPKEDLYFLSDFVCHSFDDSNKLLDAIFKMKRICHRAIGFDGNVSQESTWTQHVRNWCRLKEFPFPRIEYKKYHVDDLSKNIQSAWNEGKILLPHNIIEFDDGKRLLTQIFAFAGKKANLADDAPDAMICAFELLHERKLGKRLQLTRKPTVIQDYYF
jgi:hypothetical protein